MQWRYVTAWAFAVLTLALLTQTLSGDGRGWAGSGVMTSMGWSYLVLLLGLVTVASALWPPRKEAST